MLAVAVSYKEAFSSGKWCDILKVSLDTNFHFNTFYIIAATGQFRKVFSFNFCLSSFLNKVKAIDCTKNEVSH